MGSRALIDLFQANGNVVTTLPTLEFHNDTMTSFITPLHRFFRQFIQRLSKPAMLVPYSLDHYSMAELDWESSKQHHKKKVEDLILESDVVVFNAEGCCHSNNYAARKGLFLLFQAKKKYGKSTLFMNGSVTFNLHSTDRLSPVFRYVSDYIDAFYVREHLSLAALRDAKVDPGKALYLPDSTFKYAEDFSKISSTPIVGGKYFLISSSMSKPFAALKPEQLPLGKVVDRLANNFGKPTFIVKDPEDRYIEKFALANGYEIFSDGDRLKLFNLFYHANFLFSGRFHHIVLATLCGCPAIAMNTTSCKNFGIVQMLSRGGYGKDLINPSALSYSMNLILEQAESLSRNKMRNETKKLLLNFSTEQYRMLMKGFGL